MSQHERPAVVGGEDARHLASSLAERAFAAIEQALVARGRARVALSGGSSPKAAYRKLAELVRGLSSAPVHWFWVDERAVPPDHERSNYALVKRELLEPAGIPDAHVFRMPAEKPDLEQAARAYSEQLAAEFGLSLEAAQAVDAQGRAAVRFDVIVAGIGADGHTASLFPGSGAVSRGPELVTAVHPGGGLEPRLSLTRPVLVSGREILILAPGADKRAVVQRAWERGAEEEIPARLYQAAAPGAVTWFLDGA
jgi:6-phosphogluconolactonase